MGPTYRDMPLPIGMRFRPSDLEMAVYFLRNKALGLTMKARTVPEECHDIFSIHPRDLPGYGSEEHWYFYCQKTKNQVTITKSYHLWIPTGEETDVLDPKKNDELVGIKRSFAFMENEEEEEEASDNNNNGLSDEEEKPPQYNWFLDEISLPLTVLDTDWVLCHIFNEKVKPEFVNLLPAIVEFESESDPSDVDDEEEDETVLPPPPASP
ncbi:NAC domain superfamily [Arabidopsis thaliana x Arabidopsis arenosa]|uniref:NAC domain superfamily n=1 Tax=Arabidopsis thaliana x Arabidopsis arenosa TaxID=1240361 RepID=A0A8T1YDP3_9BRAS|nr:NAC domain superfamily [Arabidopsis thaliana x Arabidopsis arenosa]